MKRVGFMITACCAVAGTSLADDAVGLTVRLVGQLITPVDNDGKVIGQDGGYSVAWNIVGGTKTLWTFGDTISGNHVPAGYHIVAFATDAAATSIDTDASD